MSCFSLHTNSTTVAEADPTKHVNYNVGMVLGVDDFTQEFAYLAGRDRWMARDLIGYGTVRGLNVRIEVDATKGPRVAVEPGVALSPGGQMICVPAAQCAYLKNWVADHGDEISPVVGSPPASSLLLYVVLCYRSCPTDNVPIAGEPCRSEDKLTAPSRLMDDFSLELRLEKPNQREENAVRDFVAWLRQVNVSDDPSTPLDQFLQAIRDAASAWLASPLSPPSSPLDDFMFGSPPGFLNINTADIAEYLRAAFRVWVTELRPKWIARWHGCAATHLEGDDAHDEDCVLLAELDVPILPVSPGSFDIPNLPIPVNQDERPYLVHLRMLQEWLFSGVSAALAAGGGGMLNLEAPAGAGLRVVNLEGPVNATITDEDCVICNTTNGGIRIALPEAASNDGRVVIVKRTTTGSQVQIGAVTGETVEGQATVLLTAQNRAFQFVANAKQSGWHIIGSVA